MRTLSSFLVVLVILLWTANSAAAQLEAQITELNAQALEAYHGLDLDAARAKLEEAIGLAQQAGYMGPEVANSFMNLGVVYVAGLSDPDQGLNAFLSALCMQPDVQLDPLLSTPDVQQVFAQAQQDAAAGACGAPVGPAPGPNLMPGPSTAPPTVMGSGPQVLDVECPPGMVCDDSGEDDGPKDFARFFFNVQLVGGFAYVGSGLTADSKPPVHEIYEPTLAFNDTNGDPADWESDTFIDVNGDGLFNDLDAFDVDGDGRADDINGDGRPDNRFYFDDHSAWVPDADSFDDFEAYQMRINPETGMEEIVINPSTGRPEVAIPRGTTPVLGNCEGDGKATGPVDLGFDTYEPSRYCVRVEKPGVVSNLALRLNPGYFLTESFALSLPIRFQFDAGEGSFSHLLIGLRGEFLFSPMESATGIPVSWFFGATYGQIQAKPPPRDPGRAAPYVISGPLGVHTGVNLRIRLHRNFGFIVSPEVDLQFPDLLPNADLAGGIEAAF